MKKLGKLTLNEMQEYAPLSPQEQMEMKGGISKTWLYLGYLIAKELYDEYFKGSGSQPASSGAIEVGIRGSDSTIIDKDGTVKIYRPDSVGITIGSQ